MTMFNPLAGAAAIGMTAAPAAAQYYPQQPSYPQQYQQTYPQQYPQSGYGYNQGYQGTGNAITDVIDQLLGNRYNVTDRQAVRQCASAARAQAQSQYGGGYNGYNGQRFGQNYGQGYNQAYGALRVTSITGVQRRGNGLRVTGTLGSGGGYSGQQYGYQNRYAGGSLSFRCNVDYNGAVTGVRIGNGYRG